MRKEILNIRNLTIKKHEEYLLRNVYFRMYDKEIVGLIAREDKGANEFKEYILSQSEVPTGLIEKNSHLLDALSIAENIFVARSRFRMYFIRESVLENQLQRYCHEHGIDLPIQKRVSELTQYERCAVELMKADILGISLIVLDNPSNYISQVRLPDFFRLLRKFRDRGMSFLYIGYHHQEVFSIADRTALFANGYVKKIFLKDEMHDASIAPYINPILEKKPENKKEIQPGISKAKEEMVLQISGISLKLRKGDCISLIDMDNVLKEQIFKEILDTPNSILARWDTKVPNPIHLNSIMPDSMEMPWDVKKPCRYLVIPEDFKNHFLFQDLSYFDNLIFLLDRKLGRSLLPRRIRENIRMSFLEKVGDVVDAIEIDGLNTIDLLRLVYYKALLYKPDVLICLQPYAGGDVHCRMEVTKLIQEMQRAGVSVLIISSNVADTMDVASKMMVMENGVIREWHDQTDVKIQNRRL